MSATTINLPGLSGLVDRREARCTSLLAFDSETDVIALSPFRCAACARAGVSRSLEPPFQSKARGMTGRAGLSRIPTFWSPASASTHGARPGQHARLARHRPHVRSRTQYSIGIARSGDGSNLRSARCSGGFLGVIGLGRLGRAWRRSPGDRHAGIAGSQFCDARARIRRTWISAQ
jgi:hypothetical protein